MEDNKTITIKIPKKMKHNGITRSLQTNEQIQKKINEEVDFVIKYLPAHKMCCIIRQYLSGQNCPVKKFYQEYMNKTGIIFEVKTNYGTISGRTNISDIGGTISITREALTRIGHDPDEINIDIYIKSYPNIDTKGIQINTEVIEKLTEYKTILQKYIDECEILDNNNLDEDTIIMIKNISARKYLLKNLFYEKKQYIRHYNKMKELFIKNSTIGNFPRNYEYNNILFGWDNNLSSIPFPILVKLYLEAYDIKNLTTACEEFKIEILNISMENPKYTIQLLLDDYDYMIN